MTCRWTLGPAARHVPPALGFLFVAVQFEDATKGSGTMAVRTATKAKITAHITALCSVRTETP